jgi:hypothetical protein
MHVRPQTKDARDAIQPSGEWRMTHWLSNTGSIAPVLRGVHELEHGVQSSL